MIHIAPVQKQLVVKAGQSRAFAVFTAEMSRWWPATHSILKSPLKECTVEPHAGGCWCETLPGGGSVEHLRVVYVSPGKTLRLRGAMGPFQGLAVDGVMTWSVKSVADGTDVSLTYSIGGYAKDGFDELSKMTDHMLGEQMERFKKLVDAETAPRGH